MSAMFRSFSSFNYRVWFVGALVSNVGAWMSATTQSWVVLTQLTDNDAGAMGITMALQWGPPLLLVGLTGWAADRFDRRKLLIVTQVLLALLGLALGVLLVLGAMTLTMMFAFALVFGIIGAFDNPARQAFVSDLVAQHNASNAVALNAASFNTARMIGPAVAGLLIVAVGSGWVLIINTVSFVVMIIALALIRAGELIPRPKVARGGIAAGFRYVRSRQDLVITFVMVFLLGAFGMNFPIYASTMAVEFGRDADGYGLLSSILAIGSLAGALLAARRARARLRVVIFAMVGFGMASFIAAVMPTYWTFAAALMFVGFAVVTTLTTANGYIQTTTDAAVRGRVLALYVAVLMGGTPIGAPIIGWVANEFGPRWAMGIGAAAALLGAAVGLIWLVASGRLHRDEDFRFRLTIDETRPIDIAEPVPEEFSDEVASTTAIPTIKSAPTSGPTPHS